MVTFNDLSLQSRKWFVDMTMIYKSLHSFIGCQPDKIGLSRSKNIISSIIELLKKDLDLFLESVKIYFELGLLLNGTVYSLILQTIDLTQFLDFADDTFPLLLQLEV